jgi:stalled ribosome alternative rescue factor ArfA
LNIPKKKSDRQYDRKKIEHTKGVIRQTDKYDKKKIEHTKGVIRQTENTIEKRLNIPKE